MSGEQLVVIKDFEDNVVSEFTGNNTSLLEKVDQQQIKIDQQATEIEILKEQNKKIENLEKQIQELKDLIQNK